MLDRFVKRILIEFDMERVVNNLDLSMRLFLNKVDLRLKESGICSAEGVPLELDPIFFLVLSLAFTQVGVLGKTINLVEAPFLLPAMFPKLDSAKTALLRLILFFFSSRLYILCLTMKAMITPDAIIEVNCKTTLTLVVKT
jgi:hypothetical protein